MVGALSFGLVRLSNFGTAISLGARSSTGSQHSGLTAIVSPLRRRMQYRPFAFMSISTPCCPFTSVRDCIPINFTGLPSLILCLQASRGAGAAVLQRGVSGARAGVRLAEKVPVEV